MIFFHVCCSNCRVVLRPARPATCVAKPTVQNNYEGRCHRFNHRTYCFTFLSRWLYIQPAYERYRDTGHLLTNRFFEQPRHFFLLRTTLQSLVPKQLSLTELDYTRK